MNAKPEPAAGPENPASPQLAYGQPSPLKWIIRLGIFLASAGLPLAFYLAGKSDQALESGWAWTQSPWVGLLLLPGFLWWGCFEKRLARVHGWMLFIYSMGAMASILAGAPALLAAALLLCALAVWETAHAHQRLERVQDAAARTQLVKRHSLRLAALLLASAAGILFATQVQIRINFWVALVLGIAAIAGLTWLANRLHRESE